MSGQPKLFLDFHGRFIDALGIQMYQKPAAAIAELIANAWDSDAENVTVTLPTALSQNAEIVVGDNGRGMTFNQCQDHYLKVGRNRRHSEGDKSPKGRPILGRKGIGKFAGFGIAKRIIVDTTSEVTGERTVFALDLDKLRSDEFIQASRHPIEVLESHGPSHARKSSHGTKIRLGSLTVGRAPNVSGFAERMAQRFVLAASAQSFKVTVNGIALSAIEAQQGVEFDFPADYTAAERPTTLIKIENGEGVEKIGDDEVRWRIRFRKEPIGDEEFRGVSVFCGIKVAQTPFFFELSGGLPGQFGQQYLFGQVKADYLDHLSDDIITTERQRINWEQADARRLLEWGQAKLKELLGIWRERRAEKRNKEIDDKITPFADRLDRLQPSERQTVTSAIRKLASISTLEDAEFADLASAILTAWEQGRLRDLIRRIAGLAEAEPGVILSVMGEAQILTALHVAEAIRTKLDLVRGLRRRIEAKELENAIRDYIAKHPWLVNPNYEFYKKERSLASLLPQIAKKIKLDSHPDFAKRIDLLLAHSDHLVLMEFMRPGVRIDRDHINRFEQYVDELRARILASSGGTFHRITGVIVADKLEKSPGIQKALERLRADGMYATEWQLLLADAEREYQDYFQIMVDRTPDDPRVRNLDEEAPPWKGTASPKARKKKALPKARLKRRAKRRSVKVHTRRR
jgi:hypothetical protein